MAPHQLSVLLILVFQAVTALATLPIPELHFEDNIIEDDDTDITCTLQHTDCMGVTLEIIGNATLKNCVQKIVNQSNTVSKTCTMEVTREMDKMEFICEARFKTQSKPKKMYLQTEPTITDCPDKLVWKEGEENSFHCKATGYPIPTVTCEKDHVKYTEGVKYTTSRNMTGTYVCTARNRDVSTRSVEVSVEYMPKVLHIKVNPPLRNEGDTVTITCQADGEPAPAYSWRTPSSDVLVSPDNTTITIQSMKKGHLGAYRCTASNTHGSHSLEETLTPEVQPKILDMKVEPSSEVLEGYNVTLSCKADGSPPPTLTWAYPKADVVLSQDHQTIKISNLRKEHIGTYNCTAKNKHGNVTQSQKITLGEKGNRGDRTEMSIATILTVMLSTSLMFYLF